MFFDLNSKINSQKPFAQKEIVKSAIEDGYQGVAFSYEFTGALGPQHMCPFKKIDVLNFLNKDTNLLAKPELKRNAENFKQYSRITLTVNDPRHLTQVSDNNSIIQSYDIVAIKTTNQKIFYSCCLENDTVDIISFDLNEKLPFHLKRGPVTEAIKKGIMFEICYSQAIEDMTIRRMIFSNAIQIIRATKGKNIIVSSGAEDAFYHRSPYDAINLATIFELPKEAAYKAVSENPSKCVHRAEFRKNFKGTITIATAEEERKFLEKEAALLAKKKVKTQTTTQQDKKSTESKEGMNQKMEEEKVDVAHNTEKEDLQTKNNEQSSKENNKSMEEEAGSLQIGSQEQKVTIVQSETVIIAGASEGTEKNEVVPEKMSLDPVSEENAEKI